MMCARTRPGPAPGAAPCGRSGPRWRGPPARPSAHGRRDRDGDAGINSGSAPSRARSGIRWGGPLRRLDFHGEELDDVISSRECW